MKYLTKYKIYESEKSDKLFSIAYDCFADLIDDDYVYITNLEEDISIIVYIDRFNVVAGNFNEMIEIQKNKLDFFEDIKVSFLRLKSEYPEMSYHLLEVSEEIIEFLVSAENEEEGSFYRKVGNKIILNRKEINKILKLDNNVKLDIWQGNPNILEIEFTDKEHFNKHMYREFTDNREAMNDPNTTAGLFSNKNVKDALIINPEIGDKKIGDNFDKLKIDNIPFITGISSISIKSGTGRRSYYGSVKEETNVKLIINNQIGIENIILP